MDQRDTSQGTLQNVVAHYFTIPKYTAGSGIPCLHMSDMDRNTQTRSNGMIWLYLTTGSGCYSLFIKGYLLNNVRNLLPPAINFGSCEIRDVLTEIWRSLNSLAAGKYDWNLRHVSFKQSLVIDGWGISCEIALIWISLDFTYDQSTMVWVMVWCRQAPSHYLNQCWPRSLPPYGVTRPQWVKRFSYMSDNYYMAGSQRTC